MKRAGGPSWLVLSLTAAVACSQDFSVFRFEREPPEKNAATRPDAGASTPADASAAISGDAARPDPRTAADAAEPADAAASDPPGPGATDAAASGGRGGTGGTDAGARAGAGAGAGRGGAGAGGRGGAGGTAGAAAGGGEAGSGGGSGGAGVIEPSDASVEPVDASAEPVDSSVEPLDAAVPSVPPEGSDRSIDAADAAASASGVSPDAEDSRRTLCQAGWAEQLEGSNVCRDCACEACASPILDCLLRGDETERKRCADVLRCALQNHCQDYTCYCRTSGCGWPGSTGDGACAQLVNAAAGGTRSRVSALRNADPLDLEQPLNRAGQAIACIYGVHEASPGPPAAGSCSNACD